MAAGATGSLRGVTVDGIPYNATADANVALNDRFEKESVPHSGGNMIKYTLVSGDAEAVKITVTPSEYETLKAQVSSLDDMPLSYLGADGTSYKTQGRVNLGPFQSEDNSCELMFMTTTGVWDIFAAS